MSDFKKYLPSKKFTAIVLLIVVIIVLFFTIRSVAKYFHNKKIAKGAPTPVAVTVGSLTQKDSNDNGIPDWEEYLWGLNPNRNGEKNKEFITAKRKSLEANGVISMGNNNGDITDNEMLARQFYATIVSLQETGDVNQESVKSVAEAVGENIIPLSFNDVYTINDLKIVEDSENTKKNYHNSLVNLVNKYKDADIGSELVIISQGLANKDMQAFYATKSIAEAYISFGQELSKVAVPRSMVPIHLKVINGYEKVGRSIGELIKMLSDPIIGMKAVLAYKNYSDSLASDLEKVSEILQ